MGRAYPLSGEKLALVLTVYRARDFADAKQRVREILRFSGTRPFLGLHTTNFARARELAEDLPLSACLSISRTRSATAAASTAVSNSR